MFSHYLPLPAGVKRFFAELIPNKGVQEVKDCIHLAWKTSTDIYHEKRQALLTGDAALKQQVGEGKDIMSILRKSFIVSDHGFAHWVIVRANMEAAPEDRLPEEEVIAQMS